MSTTDRIVLAALLAASSAAAQVPERATFYLIVGNDTITIERSTRGAGELRFELFDRKSHSRVGNPTAAR